MALTYHFDLHPRTNPNGARLVRFTDLQAAEYRGEANGTGAGRFSIRADDAEAAFIDPEGLQYVRVVRDDGATELVVGGFFLDSGDYAALNEDETKLLTWEGAGTLSYLGRAVMDADSWIDDPFIGTDPQPEGVWPLHLAGTGNELGAILWRVLHEVEEPGRHQDPLPLMTLGFTYLVDSNAAAWVRTTGDFTAQVGENVISIVRRLMQMGLYVEVDPDDFEVRAYEPETHRRDRTGVAWGADIVRFQAPTDGTIATGNIKSDAKRALEAKVRRNAVLIGSQDTWLWVDDAGVTVPWEGSVIVDDESGSSLLKFGEAQLAKRSDAGDTLRLRMKLGDDEANGVYLPFEHVLLDDIVTVHTGTGQWDYNEAEFPVAALTVVLRPGGDWDAWADLGAAYLSMAERSFQAQPVGAHTHPPNPRLCAATTVGGAASCSMDPTTLTQIPTPNGDWEMGDGTNWLTGSPSAGDPEGVGGSWYFIDSGVGSGGLSYNGVAGQTFASGLTVVAYVFLDPSSTGGITIIFGSNLDIPGRTVVAASPGLNCVSWTPSGDITGVQVSLARAGSGTLAFDNVRIYSGGTGTNPLHGTSGFAARCDHVHHVLSATDPTVDDDADAGYPITTLWTNTATGDSFLSTDDSAGAAVWDAFGGGVTDHGALTGLADDDHSAYETVIAGGGPTVQAHGSMGAAETVNAANGNLHTGTLDDNCTVTVTLFAAGGIVCRFKQDAGGGNAITWAGVTFAAGADDQPGQGANEVTEFVLTSDGTTVLGYKAGAGSDGAPTDATYLVTTAHADLSAEVVVGATPGGELGGTWAAPTVDATHSGSAHHTESHQARHANGGADEVAVEGLGTAETDTALVLHPDGTGGIEWGTDEGGGAGMAGELVTDTIIGDGVEDTFALSSAPTGSWALVSTNGADLLPSEYAIVAGDIVFDVAPVNLAEVLVTFITGGYTVPATDPGDIADPTMATAEDVANKLNDLMAELRLTGVIA